MPAIKYLVTRTRIISFAALGLGLGAAAVIAQSDSALTMPTNSPENAALAALRWRNIGPANPGGRVTVVAGLPGKP